MKSAAAEQGMCLSAGQLHEVLGRLNLDEAQQTLVVQYLEQKGISVPDALVFPGTLCPPSDEEKEWYAQYLQSLPRGNPELLLRHRSLLADSASAQELGNLNQEIVTAFLPRAAQLAFEKNCRQMPLMDLVQEANIALTIAVADLTVQTIEDLEAAVLRGIVDAVRSQVDQEASDQALIGKVADLEKAVRELNDGEGESFTVAELAVILDMEEEEIHRILKLTGDDVKRDTEK